VNGNPDAKVPDKEESLNVLLKAVADHLSKCDLSDVGVAETTTCLEELVKGLTRVAGKMNASSKSLIAGAFGMLKDGVFEIASAASTGLSAAVGKLQEGLKAMGWL
jgi:hypothetical protein